MWRLRAVEGASGEAEDALDLAVGGFADDEAVDLRTVGWRQARQLIMLASCPPVASCAPGRLRTFHQRSVASRSFSAHRSTSAAKLRPGAPQVGEKLSELRVRQSSVAQEDVRIEDDVHGFVDACLKSGPLRVTRLMLSQNRSRHRGCLARRARARARSR